MSCNAHAMTANDLPSTTTDAGSGRVLQRLAAAAGAAGNAIGTWFYRIRYRHELYELSDRQLADMGIDRDALKREVAKPFWIE